MHCHIGSFLYLILKTHPDLAFVVTQMAKFAHNPSEEHLTKARHIMCYPTITCKYTLDYDGSSDGGLYFYCDSSYGDDRSDPGCRCQSMQRYYFSLANGCIKWHYKNTDTDLCVLRNGRVHCFLWLCTWLCMVQDSIWQTQKTHAPCLYLWWQPWSDLQYSKSVTQKGINNIKIHYHYIWEQVKKGKVKVSAIPPSEKIANMFTKNLGPILFLKHRKELSIEYYPL